MRMTLLASITMITYNNYYGLLIYQYTFQLLSQRPSNKAKRTARTILLGPPGSGKRLIAQKLAERWKMVQGNA